MMKLLFENWRRYLDESVMDAFYKGKQDADLNLQHVRDMYDIINKYYEIFYADKSRLRYPRRSHYKTLRRKHHLIGRAKEIIGILEPFEANSSLTMESTDGLDGLLSRMLVVQKQMESGDYNWPKEFSNPPRDRIQKLGPDWRKFQDPEKFIPFAIKKLQTARENLLEALEWIQARTDMEEYTPPETMADLQRLMDYGSYWGPEER